MRPIDADEVYKEMEKKCEECGRCDYLEEPDKTCGMYMARGIIEMACVILPHDICSSNWQQVIAFDNVEVTECMACHGESPNGWYWRYCPHCGAFMKNNGADNLWRLNRRRDDVNAAD